MKSLFEESAYRELHERINQLSPNSKGSWGKMSVGQMVWHCQIPLKIAVKNKPNSGKAGNPLVRWFFKKSLYNDKQWRKNLPTAPFAKATEEKDFTTEIEELRKVLDACYETRHRNEWNPHPLFGNLTSDQWGKMEYKHLDHHLRQFGV